MKLEVTIDLSRSMLTSEENIQQSLNEGGCLATATTLKWLDTDGSAIEIAGQVHDLEGADVLLDDIQANALLADKSYDAQERVLDRLEAQDCNLLSVIVP